MPYMDPMGMYYINIFLNLSTAQWHTSASQIQNHLWLMQDVIRQTLIQQIEKQSVTWKGREGTVDGSRNPN